MKKPGKDLSEIRQYQRAHAKRRFQERFDLTLNRHQIREIERKIAGGHAIRVEIKTNKVQNYLVVVDGGLIAVGYNTSTKRLVTALPDAYLQGLSPETVLRAILRLVPGEAEHIIDLIERGKAAPLYRRSRRIIYYEVPHGDQPIRVGYHEGTRKLLPYRDPPQHQEHSAGFLPLSLPITTSESLRQQIKNGSSRFLWRHSGTFTFHEVRWAGRPIRVGYSNSSGILYDYQEPPESMVELRSSLRLLDQPVAVRAAVVEIVKTGEAQLLAILGQHNRAYRVDLDGDVYYFEFDDVEERIGPWRYRGSSS